MERLILTFHKNRIGTYFSPFSAAVSRISLKSKPVFKVAFGPASGRPPGYGLASLLPHVPIPKIRYRLLQGRREYDRACLHAPEVRFRIQSASELLKRLRPCQRASPASNQEARVRPALGGM